MLKIGILVIKQNNNLASKPIKHTNTTKNKNNLPKREMRQTK
jgi:hypothetical protein